MRCKQNHPGFLALHVAINDHSSMAFTQKLARSEGLNHHRLFELGHRVLRTHGIGVRTLLTDNGSSYRSQLFRQACQKIQIQHRRTNGKAERFIQTAPREWAYAKHWTDSQQKRRPLAAMG